MARRSVESSVENLFDGFFSRIFRSGVKPLQIGRRLIQVVDDERSIDARGRRVVPNSYVVQLSPEDREQFEDLEMSLLQELTVALREYIAQEGYHCDGKARVALRTDPQLKRGRITVEARNGSGDSPASPATASPRASRDTGGDHDRPPAVLTLPSGQRIEIHEGRYVLGRQLQSDIVLNDSNVSRRHAEFECSGGEVVVRDLGSTNGTKVNGVAVHGDQLLQHGDVIGLGSIEVRFEVS